MTQNDIFGQLTAVFIEWQGFLKDPQYIHRGGEISWDRASQLILSENLTRRDVLEISRMGQYSFRVAGDESIIQISYRFDPQGDLQSARLAFYEVGSLTVVDEEIEVLPIEQEDGPNTLARWIRFDYCNTGLGRVLHMDCHLHVSGLPGTRFAVTGVPTPRQFIEFIAAHFYPTEYKKIRLDEDQRFNNLARLDSVNSASIRLADEQTEVYSRIPHFRIPVRFATNG
jgi:hypothetical protein